MSLKKFLVSVAIIICGLVFLFMCNEEAVFYSSNGDPSEASSAADQIMRQNGNGSQDTQEDSYNTYSYQYKYVTDIEVTAENANVILYTEKNAEEILVKTKNIEISGSTSDGTLLIEALSKENGFIYIYVPERMYVYKLNVTKLTLETDNSIKGSIVIRSNTIDANIRDFVGWLDIQSNDGAVNIDKGNLNMASSVYFSRKGNVFLNTKFSDIKEKYMFSTNEGIVKINTAGLLGNTVFDVYTLAVNGEYNEMSLNTNENNDKVKVRVVADYGIATFYE